MGDQPRSTSLDFYSILGIKSLVSKWNPDKKSHKQGKSRHSHDNSKEKNVGDFIDWNEPEMRPPPSPTEFDENFFFRPPILLRSLTKKNQFGSRRSTSPDKSRSKSTGRGFRSNTGPPSPTDSSSHGSRRGKGSSRADSSRSRSTDRRSKSQTLPITSPTELSSSGTKKSTSPSSSGRGYCEAKNRTGKRSASETEIPSLVTPSGKSQPILYSQSTTWRTPQAIEMKLECTLEELCHGCEKKIAITRDVFPNGVMKKEEEVLTIDVKPGWRKGTKIRFEGKGSEIVPGNAADIVFLIEELNHPLFTREGDDLEYGIEIPLMEALIGCSISVPLLGEESMWLTFSDIIYPGFQKVLPGQGMPTKVQGKRGNLRLKFFIQFPEELTDQQRSEASSILQDCF